MRLEVRVAGFGGQGIIKAGLILAMASCIYGGKNAVQTQSYGPEARGGACRSEVVISDEEIDFPKAIEPNFLVLMSQEAYDTYADTVKKGGIILLDPDLIPKRKSLTNVQIFEVPATRIAEKLGRTIVANVVMLGALTAITRLVDAESMRKSILENIPRGTEELNLKAFEKGYEYGKKLLERRKA